MICNDMIVRFVIVMFFMCEMSFTVNAQVNTPSSISSNLGIVDNRDWNGKRCAVVLTYDDGLNEHLDVARLQLDSVCLKGTFYIPCSSTSFRDRLEEWRSLALDGHEIGNHTIYHPCAGKSKRRELSSLESDLDSYTVDNFIDELRLANVKLRDIDGEEIRTFAYPCGDQAVGDSSFVHLLKDDFIMARSVYSKTEELSRINLYNVGGFILTGNNGAALIKLVEHAKTRGRMIVLIFHGVGGGHELNVSKEAHRELLEYLKKNSDDIWVPTMKEIAKYLIELKNF